MRCDKGFTFIEILCVLAIMAIISGMAMPDINRWLDRETVESSARQITAAIRKTRQVAMTHGKDMKLELYSNGRYTIREYDVTKPSLETEQLSARLDDISSTFPDDLYNIEVVGFNAYGRPTGGGGTIKLRAGQEWVEVSVLPVTGRVKVYR
ncbi:prepilin-type N-terminal cleavage/methylation domain-containing protein [Mahella sp.]|uniref:prepilin-type N-terminal cleavage/methylation domain-containing protein n=1 Tax=Mahella sp. TaxID=2798721 RepID=UPI0025C49423|nr:prepilin-type N-terminal cleavage/methylation domain-containing protein [Mahella sp.]